MRSALRIVIVLTVAAALISGCTHDGPPSPAAPPASPTEVYPNWPASLRDFRFHWTAEPGIALESGVSVPVRAYLESYDIATFTRNLANVYPGFMRATPENDELDGHYLAQLAWIRPLNGVDTNPDGALEHFGYIPFHVLRIDPVDDGYRAIVCQGKYADFIKSTTQPGKFVSAAVDPATAQPRPADSGVVVHRLELTTNDPRVGADAPAEVTRPQRGPLPAPDEDVFGKWFFTGASSSFWGPIDAPNPERFPAPELESQCNDRMPHNEPERLAMMTGFKDRPPPHGAAPGWPVKPN
jgi:hypothetical protein